MNNMMMERWQQTLRYQQFSDGRCFGHIEGRFHRHVVAGQRIDSRFQQSRDHLRMTGKRSSPQRTSIGVAPQMNIRAALNEEGHDRQVSLTRRFGQRRVLSAVHGINVVPAVQPRHYRFKISTKSSVHQLGTVPLLLSMSIDFFDLFTTLPSVLFPQRNYLFQSYFLMSEIFRRFSTISTPLDIFRHHDNVHMICD